MKKTLITLLLIAAAVPAVQAQDRIYRCGNEYTNNAQQAKERGCKLVEGGTRTSEWRKGSHVEVDDAQINALAVAREGRQLEPDEMERLLQLERPA